MVNASRHQIRWARYRARVVSAITGATLFREGPGRGSAGTPPQAIEFLGGEAYYMRWTEEELCARFDHLDPEGQPGAPS